MADDYTFAEHRRKKDRQALQESHDEFEDDLSFSEYSAATRDLQESFGGAFGVADMSTEFSNQKRKAKKKNAKRSSGARASDSGKLAPLTTSYSEWSSDMDDLDFPGVDTPDDRDLTGFF